MSIRCFVSCLTDLSTFGGLDRFISAVIDQRFIVRDGRLVARGYADLHAGLFHNYTKDIILEISYDGEFIVRTFWEAEWLDGDGMPMTQYDREKASGVCTLKVAEEKAIKFFQKEAEKMLERIIYYHWDEIKQVLRA